MVIRRAAASSTQDTDAPGNVLQDAQLAGVEREK